MTSLYSYIFSCRAFVDYKKEFVKGDDKTKPDWNARKSCNYMISQSGIEVWDPNFGFKVSLPNFHKKGPI